MHRNKHGWIKIVEAFVAIILIVVVLLIVIQQGYIGDRDRSSEVYEIESNILREIELNDNLRQEILGLTLKETPVNASQNVIDFMESRVPAHLGCVARVCQIDRVCFMEPGTTTEDVYSQLVSINAETATPGSEEYSPRKLQMFCWFK